MDHHHLPLSEDSSDDDSPIINHRRIRGNDIDDRFPSHPIPGRQYPQPRSSGGGNYRGDLFEFTRKAIDHYNSTNLLDQFELVDPLVLRHFRTSNWRDDVLQHVSFVARSREFNCLKLFFAEFACCRQVQICTTVNPGNPFVRSGCGACHPDGIIYHPYGSKSGFRERGGAPQRMRNEHAYAKKFFSDVYTITTTVEELLEPYDTYKLNEKYKRHTLEALKKFNSKSHESYELVEVLACNRFLWVSDYAPYWAHLNFVAKVEHGDGTESSPVLFFAEVGFMSDNDYYKTSCVVISTGDDSAIPLSEKCTACPDHCPLLHPKGKYVAGNDEGVYADSLHGGCFKGVRSKLMMKTDTASGDAREEFYTYLWSGEGSS